MKNRLIPISMELFKGNIRYLIIFVLLIGGLGLFMPLIEPILMQNIFDALGTNNYDVIIKVCTKLGLFILFTFILAYVQNCYCDIWLYRLIGNGNSKSLEKYHLMPYGEKVNRYEEGDVFNRINSGVENIAYTWLFAILIIFNLVSLIVLIVLGIKTSFGILLYSIILFVIVTVCTKIETIKNIEYEKKQQEVKSIKEENLYVLIDNMEFFSMTATSEIIRKEYTDNRRIIWNIQKKRTFMSIYFETIQSVFKELFYGAIAYTLFPLKSLNLISVGQLTAAFSIYDSFFSSLSNLKRPIINLARSIVPVHKLDEMLKLNREVIQNDIDIDCGNVIRIKDVSLKLDEKPILNGINLDIKEKEKIAIIGKNGCGKSTLLKVILGLYCPKIGSCIVKNKNVAIMNYEERRSAFSFIPSKTQLFNQTSRWNIESGMDRSESNEIEEISQKFKMSDEVNSFINENAINLSGGQVQRVNVARGLVHKADILIADEPTASLDNEIGNTVISEITSKNSTIIVVTHNKEHLKFFDRIIIMNNGIIVADLDKDKLNINEHYKEWLGVS